jgi:hypothetical protein
MNSHFRSWLLLSRFEPCLADAARPFAALSFQKIASVKTAPRLVFRTLFSSFSGSTDLADGQKVLMRNTKKSNNQGKKSS